MSTYKLDKASSAKDSKSLDKRIELLFQEKEKIEKNQPVSTLEPVTESDLEKLNFSDDLDKIKAIQRERVLEDLSTLLNEKIKELETANVKLQEEKKHSDELNQSLKAALKKLSDAEMQLKIERDWLAEQVEKKSVEVLKTIDQLIKAENAKSNDN